MPKGTSTSVYWQPQTETRAKALADRARLSVSALISAFVDKLWNEPELLESLTDTDTPRPPYDRDAIDPRFRKRDGGVQVAVEEA